MKLLFGTAGIPIATKPRDTINGVATVRQLGLDAMEMEFVHSVNISEQKAIEVKKIAETNHVTLTCHAPYYINLNGEKAADSSLRLLKAARILKACGGWSMCFHAGFYMKQEPTGVYDRIRDQIKQVAKTLKDEGNDVWVRPEIGGKPTAFGSLDELIRISDDIEGVLPCIDFAHMHARSNGKYNTHAEFSGILEQIEKKLGKHALANMHIHTAGIKYSEKGELSHLNLRESDLRFKELVKAWKDFKVGGVVIAESPNIESDSLLLKKTYDNC